MGAVVGGVSEGLVTFGIAGIAITQIAAIVMLTRSFERGHTLRGFFSAISICCSLFLIVFVTTFVWLLVRFAR